MLPARNDSLICWGLSITRVELATTVLAMAVVGISCGGAAPTSKSTPAAAVATSTPTATPTVSGPLPADLTAPEAPIAAPPPAAPIDISDVKAHLTMVSDDDGNIYAYTLDPNHEAVAFYGDGKTMYTQYVYEMTPNLDGGGYRVDIATPYGQRGSSIAEGTIFADEHKQLTLICKGNEPGVPLHPVPAAEKKRILDTAHFMPRKWSRHLALLARDDTGIYFLVDRAWGHEHSDYHVYLGKRGAMKQVALSNVVDDAAGMIFSTARGELRLVQGSDHVVYWVNKGVKTPLVFLDLELLKNQQMVFHDLGVYGFVGAPCEGVQ